MANILPVAKDPDTLAENSSPVEKTKHDSRGLRGTIAEGLSDDTTGAISDTDTQLIKFHGIYQQDDRDLRTERAERKLEPDYSFMIRLRVPGGLVTAQQWLALDRAATDLTRTGTLRLTTRQTLQFHGVPKENLRPLIQSYNRMLLDSIAACGDVNRNVMCTPHPGLSAAHRQCHEAAVEISRRLLPATRAYHEIWLEKERIAGGPPETEPLYGRHYLPRKFKIGVAVPPANDVDVYSQDIGFIAVVEDGALAGFNVCVGGGLGMTHGDVRTYPRLADVIGFCEPQAAPDIAWHTAALQRDHGDRSERKLARFKYTVARLGIDNVIQELAKRTGFSLERERPVSFESRQDNLEWRRDAQGDWQTGVFVQNGRIGGDTPKLQSALRAIAELDCCHFLLTPNQNLLFTAMSDKDRCKVKKLLAKHGLATGGSSLTGLRRNSMACVALPSCPLAMAEAERYLPDLVTKLEELLGELGIADENISIRMTGCPNGCARPYLGEIGLVGKAPGRYNLFLGASYLGERLSALHSENLGTEAIFAILKDLLGDYARNRNDKEPFGDYLLRAGKTVPPAGPASFHHATA